MGSAFGNYFPGITINDAIGDAFDFGQHPSCSHQARCMAWSFLRWRSAPMPNIRAPTPASFRTASCLRARPSGPKGDTRSASAAVGPTPQLNMRDHRTGTGNVDTPDFVTFANNWVTPYTTQLFTATTFLQGNADRYFRANETGLFVQDKFQVTAEPEHHGRRALRLERRADRKVRQPLQLRSLPIQLRCGVGHHHQLGLHHRRQQQERNLGVSKTTLTGRQWGIAPRFGFAWQPSNFHSKFVVRGGSGFYYDRGELFTYLSPGYAAGEIDGGPFGICRRRPSSPSSTARIAPPSTPPTQPISTCITSPSAAATDSHATVDNSTYNLATPWGTTLGPGPSNPKASDIANYLPNAARDYRRHGRRQQQRSAIYSGRLQPRQQAAIQHQFHAEYPIPAAQRSHDRDRIRGQSRPPSGDSHSL